MAEKRQHGDGGNESSSHTGPEFKRQFLTTASGVSENGLSVEELMQKILPLIQDVVREEIRLFLRPPQNQVESSGLRTLQLHIDCELPATIFTGNRILSESGNPVKIVLRDSGSKNIITSGSLSSLKVDVVILDGDFSPDDQNNWTQREFESKIVQNRKGKRPLVIEELTVELQEGVGYIGKAILTDNSSWTKSKKFILGVKVDAKYNIREGVSRAFRVKDCRGELYQKNYSPLLDTEVWLLDGIAKNGAFHKRLTQSGIYTVGDFLRSYDTNPSSLRSLLKISGKRWNAVIKHAKTCKLDDDNVNYPSSSMQNANFPVQREMQMNLAHPTTSLAEPLHNYEVEQECSLIQGFNTWAPPAANYADLCPSIKDPNAASTFQVDELFLDSTTQEMDTFSSNPVFRFP